tara:strand:- start:122 stop:988 length:867 start_codon:yes stop_codon:yes gene_type:complete
MIKGNKNRKAFIEEISVLQNFVANFSSSDQHYSNVINRLIEYTESNPKEKVRVLFRILKAFPQLKSGVNRNDYRLFLSDFEMQISKDGLTDEFLNDELNEKEQKIIDLYRDENISKKSRIIEFLNSDIAEPSQHSSLGKSKMIIEFLQRLKTSYDPSSDKLTGTELGISFEDFQEDLKALEEEKRILMFRIVNALRGGFLNNELASFTCQEIINSGIEEDKAHKVELSDESKIIEKLTVAEKSNEFQRSRDIADRKKSRNPEPRYDSIFWAIVMSLFAIGLMYFINSL